jgi:segregation and condensation protein B
MDSQQLKNIVEAALLASGGPLTLEQLRSLFGDSEQDCPERSEIREALKELTDDYAGRGIEIREVASGFRVQIREEMSRWLTKLWEDRPPRYSRALMETLAIVVYRQPVTRGDIEEIRGVSVTSNIIRTLLERDWIKVVGHRDVPGKPAMFGSTRGFLDYFGLKKLDDLPPLAELAAMEPVAVQLELGTADQELPEEAQSEDGQVEQEAAQLKDDADTAVSDDGAVAGADDETMAGPVVAERDVDVAANLEEGSFVDEDEDLDDVDDDFIASALAMADSANTDFIESGQKSAPAVDVEEATQAADQTQAHADAIDVAPGAVAPLVGLRAPGEAPPEPATVASLDKARAAAADAQAASKTADANRDDDEHEAAGFVPLKNS